ncbi:MAG: hypothetical protein KDN20_19440 [Verrucomicrobiae bacterium]|nr:hypothetical protein [Verrucomicrobiae bacterium]
MKKAIIGFCCIASTLLVAANNCRSEETLKIEFRGIESEVIQSGDEIFYFKLFIVNQGKESVGLDLIEKFTKSGLPLVTGVEYLMKFENRWWNLVNSHDLAAPRSVLRSGDSMLAAVAANPILDLGEGDREFVIRIGGVDSQSFKFEDPMKVEGKPAKK